MMESYHTLPLSVKWGEQSDLNRHRTGSQPVALPLSYVRSRQGGSRTLKPFLALEPKSSVFSVSPLAYVKSGGRNRTRVYLSNYWPQKPAAKPTRPTPEYKDARVGFEPTSTVPETVHLPLVYQAIYLIVKAQHWNRTNITRLQN